MSILSALVLCALLGSCFFAWYVWSLFKGPNYANLRSYYPFKSEAKKKLYAEYYESRSREWPIPSHGQYVATTYGKTYVRVCGPETAPSLVLLPSGFASSLIWLPNAQELVRHFRIYAVDNIYDVGQSVNNRPVTSADDLTEWLDELFTALGLGNGINVMGLSFGGWLASQYVLRHQERLRKAVLVAPVATILPLPAEWAWRGILGALPPHRFFMRRFLTNWMCRDLTEKGDAVSKQMLSHWMDDALMAMKCFAFRMPITPTVLADEEMRAIMVPVLLIVGKNEVVYPADQAVERVKTLAPSILTRVIPHAGHDVTITQTRVVNSAVSDFLLES